MSSTALERSGILWFLFFREPVLNSLHENINLKTNPEKAREQGHMEWSRPMVYNYDVTLHDDSFFLKY